MGSFIILWVWHPIDGYFVSNKADHDGLEDRILVRNKDVICLSNAEKIEHTSG